MYLVPYASCSPGLTWVFLSQGKQVWMTEEGGTTPEEAIRDYLEPNGFQGRLRTCKRGDVLLYEVDLSKTKMSEFWQITDLERPTVADAWRPFFWLEGASVEESAMNLGLFGSAFELGQLIRSTYA